MKKKSFKFTFFKKFALFVRAIEYADCTTAWDHLLAISGDS